MYKGTKVSFAKKQIRDIPFDELYANALTLLKEDPEAGKRVKYREACTAFSEKYSLANHPWVVEQLCALVAQFRCILGSDGRYDAKATLAENIKLSDHWMLGAYIMMVYSKRGDLVKEQYKPASIGYCALVPLILSGFKKYQNIPYSAWSLEGLDSLVDRELFLAMSEKPPQLEKTDLLIQREAGLTIKSGPKVGQLRNPETTHKLYLPEDSALKEAPWLQQVMLAQIWCAHPTNRAHTKYMILDPVNWDNTPEPLVDVSVVPKKETKPLVPKVDQAWEW